jgi:hypothetical protein
MIKSTLTSRSPRRGLAGPNAREEVRFGQLGEAGKIHQGKGCSHAWTIPSTATHRM